jgi:hypothetical protein
MGIAGQDEDFLRLRACHRCYAPFWICRPCDRGQQYCSSPCRASARREQQRLANRRHQQSPEGRLDHRDRQRAYRKRCAQRRVTDQSSLALLSASNMQPWDFGSTQNATQLGSSALRVRFRALPPWYACRLPPPRCVICGRWGHVRDPFILRLLRS